MADDTNVSSQEKTLKSADAPSGASASFVRERYDKAMKATRHETHQYWLNHAFLDGEQWLFWNREARRLDVIATDPDRVQATVDRMGPASRIVISKLISRELDFEVPPTGADDASLQGAYTSKSIVDSVKVEHDWEQLREALMWAGWKGGTAAIAVDWDPSLGKPVGVSKATGRDLSTGDTVETMLAITEFAVEPGVRNGEKARWWVKGLALPPEEVQAMYNLPKKPAADAAAGMSPSQARLLSSSSGSTGSEIVDLTLVITYYERPNGLSPKGKVMTVVGEQIVDGPYDWTFPFTDHLNLAILRESVIDGKWLGHTVVSKARSVQVLYNLAWSSISEHMKNAGNARLGIKNLDLDLIDQLSDLPGEMFGYSDVIPQYISPPTMPAWWIQQPEMLGHQIDDILGVHDVSRGVTPNNVESGVGLSILSENDNTPTGRMIQDTARTFGQVATMVLEIYAQNVSETRSAVVTTPGYPPETVQWTGKDLMGQTRAIVPLEAIVPRSRAAMEQLAQKALELGLITKFDQFAEIAELPDRHSLIQAVAPDVAKARRENHEMALGRVSVPAPFDDDNIHITEHHNFMKSPRYELLDKEQQNVYMLHCQAHETQAAEKAGRAAGQMMVNPLLAAAPNATGPVPLQGGANGSTPPLGMDGDGDEGSAPAGSPAAAAMTPKPTAGGPGDTLPGAPPAL